MPTPGSADVNAVDTKGYTALLGVALLEKLGSANFHNCRSDQCVPATVEDKKPAPTAKPASKSESN